MPTTTDLYVAITEGVPYELTAQGEVFQVRVIDLHARKLDQYVQDITVVFRKVIGDTEVVYGKPDAPGRRRAINLMGVLKP